MANPSPDHSRNTLKGGAAWMLLARLAETSLGVVNTAILARLLLPADFGLMALATSVMAAVEVLGAFGFDWALVRQPQLARVHLDTAWTLRVIIGLVSFAILWAIASPVADYYGDSRLALIVPMLGAAVLFSCCENPGVALFRRDFRFGKEFALRTVPKVLAMCITIPVALVTRSWEALLGGIVVGRFSSSAFTYFMHSHRPRFTLEASSQLLSFSVWLSINNILDFFRWRLSAIVIGKYLGNRSVGLFSVSMDLANLATTELAAPINRAVFSRYSQLGSDYGAIGAGFLTAGPTIWLIALPVAAGIGLTAPQIIYLQLGPNWSDGVDILRLTAIAGAFHVMSANTAYVYWAVGKSKLVTVISSVSVTVLITGILLSVTRYGLVGIAFAHIIASLVVLPINYGLLMRLLRIPPRQFLARVWRILASAIAMVAIVLLIAKNWTPHSSGAAFMQLLLLASIGSATYFLTLAALWALCGKPQGPERLVVDTILNLLARAGIGRGPLASDGAR